MKAALTIYLKMSLFPLIQIGNYKRSRWENKQRKNQFAKAENEKHLKDQKDADSCKADGKANRQEDRRERGNILYSIQMRTKLSSTI